MAALAPVPAVTAQVPTNGLIAHYPLDGDTKDKSGAANDGTGTAVTPTADRYGVANGAYLFNGVNSVITVPHSAAQNAMPLTVACWFKIAGTWQGEGALVGKYSAASWSGWQLGINPSTHLVPWYLVSQTNTVIGDYGGPPFLGGGNLDNAWHHAIFTVDAAMGGRLYLDGALVSQRDWVGPAGAAATASVLRVGQYVGSFNGAIDEVRIYNRALSATEVVQFYLAQTPAATPVMTAQPRTVWINSGDPAKFSVMATGATSYQWYRYLDGIGQTAIAGATAAELTLPAAQFNATSGGYYVVLAQNAAGLTWSDYAYTLFITRQPANATVTVGGTQRFAFEVTEPQHAPGQAFQWRRNGVVIAGATGTSYTTPAATLADHGAVFDVEFSRVQAGLVSTGLSAKAVMSIAQSPATPVITAQPRTVWINSGDPAKFSVMATGATSYQWYRYLDGIGQTAIAGATAAELTLPAAQFNATSGGYYVVLAQNAAGLTWSDYAYTLFITRQPANATVTVGGTQRFAFEVTEPQHAPGQAFQWRRNGVVIAGATGTSYTTPAATLADHGAVFDVEFSRVQAGLVSTGLSAKAVLTVNPPVVATLPVVVTQPQSLTVAPGERVSLFVNANGATSYQWSRNGAAIGGATTATLVIASAATADAGSYVVAVTNGVGTVSSNAAVLTVSTLPLVGPASATHSSPGYVAGGTATITVTMTYAGSLSALGYRAVIPSGWSYAGGSGEPGVKPASGNTGALEWAWASVGASPLTFTFTVNVPSGASGTQLVTGTAHVRFTGGAGATDVGATPGPLSLAALAGSAFHSADVNRNRAISLTELTRVIELFNYRVGTVRTGQYREQGGTEDGYSAGAGAVATFHSADTNREGAIGLTELTRVMELFNFRIGTVRTGQYRVEPGGEDGFAPGP